MTDPKKRSLKLMSEVLPDPRPNRDAARAGASTARARTQAHMQRLLAASAAMSVAACSRSTGYGVVDPMPPPADADAGGPGIGGDAAPTPPTATVAPPTSMGYGVVDPMPMPACPDVGAQIAATAEWTKGKGGERGAITVHVTAKPGTFAIVFGTPGAPAGGKIVSTRVVGATMTLVVAPDPAAAAASLFVSVASTCDKRPFTVSLSISNLAGPDAGAPVVAVQAY